MNCYAFNLLLGCSIIQYTSHLSISPTIYLDFEVGNTAALCCVEVGVKQEDLHEIASLRYPDLFRRLKNVFRGLFTIYYTPTDGVYISMPPLCTLETACPFFPKKYF